MRYEKHLAIPAALGLGIALSAATPAAAQTAVACNDTSTLPNPVYLAGSSAFEPTLAQLALQIKAKQNISIIYDPISSCTGVVDVVDPTQTLSGTAHYYVADPTQPSGVGPYQSCTLPGSTRPLIGVSDVFYDSCTGMGLSTTPPSTVGEWHGPVQAMLFVVPESNVTSTALSWQQASAIYGCGANGAQSPFIIESSIQQRSATSGTQTMIGAAIDVPPSAFKGKSNGSSTLLVSSLLGDPNPQSAIGILAADAYDPLRARLNSLAFRGKNQTKAYYADSDANSLDKKNIRDGHYMIQGPLHFFSNLTNGAPSAPAKQILDWITGAVPIDPNDTNNTGYITTVALAGDVPQCAMKVKNSSDGGKFSHFTPPVACNCFFEKVVSKLSAAPTGCLACTSDSGCTGGKRCQTGYCE